MKPTIHLAPAVLAGIAALALSACGSSSTSTTSSTAATATTAGVTATGAWVRVTAPHQMTAAVYMTLTSHGGDTLTAASVPTSIAASAELHETTTATGSGSTTTSMGSSTTSSAMTMKPVSSIAIPAGGTVVLKPGGFHIMLMKLAKPITSGEKVPVTLTLTKAGTVTVDAVARAN